MTYSAFNEYHGKIICPLSWIYVYGELETFLGFNNITTDEHSISVKHHLLTNPLVQGTVDHYIIDTEAMNDAGETLPVKLYMWRADGIPRGLAVSIYNNEDLAYAFEMYTKKSAML